METVKTLCEKTGFTRMGLYNRAKKLGLKSKYKDNGNGVLYRVFSDEDVQAIISYKKGKPGRKPNALR